MNRQFPFAVTLLLSSLMCSAANADPDRSLVRVEIDDDSSKVAVSGGTRMDVVDAVLHGLKKCRLPYSSVTVGPSFSLPDDDPDAAQAPTLIVCIDDRWERGKTTAYIANSAEVPFEVVRDVSARLRKCGFDVRLLSDETMRELLQSPE